MLRAYAAAIGLDPSDVLQEFFALFPESDPFPQPAPEATSEFRPIEVIRWLLAGMTSWRSKIRRPIRLASPGASIIRGGVVISLLAGSFLAGFTVAGGELPRRNRAQISVAPAHEGESGSDPRVSNGDALLASAAAPAVAEAQNAIDVADEGRLVVTSEPSGARVTVNGIGWGSTPVTIRHLPSGDKEVRVSKDGYVSVQRIVQLTSDHPQHSLRLQLREAATE
jgi:hypothetical protein